jgi:hypothetical protein
MSCNDTLSGLIAKPEKFSYIEAKKADIQELCANSITGAAGQYAIISMTMTGNNTDLEQNVTQNTPVIVGANATSTRPLWGLVQGDLAVTITDDPSGVAGDGNVITIPTAGRYDIDVYIQQIDLDVTPSNLRLRLIDNTGAAFDGVPLLRDNTDEFPQMRFRTIADMAAGDTIRLEVTSEQAGTNTFQMQKNAQVTIRRI